MENFIGNLVLSTSGRDKNHIYLVYDISENYVFLVDGDIRKIINPKKKNIKHIKVLNFNNEAIKSKIEAKTKVFDSEIYSYIKKIKNEIDIFNNI